MREVLCPNRDLRAPEFESHEEKTEFLKRVLKNEIPFPIMNGGMGIDFSNEHLASAVTNEGGLLFSASGPEEMRKDPMCRSEYGAIHIPTVQEMIRMLFDPEFPLKER